MHIHSFKVLQLPVNDFVVAVVVVDVAVMPIKGKQRIKVRFLLNGILQYLL